MKCGETNQCFGRVRSVMRRRAENEGDVMRAIRSVLEVVVVLGKVREEVMI